MASIFTPEAVQGGFYAAFNAILNRKDPIKADRKAMPWFNFLSKNEGNAPVIGITPAGTNGPTVKYQLTSDLDIQGFERRDVLAFSEAPIELETAFPWSNVHCGQEFVHDDIEMQTGMVILPNAARSARIGKADSESEAYQIINYFDAKMDAQSDKFDIAMDYTLLADNSINPKLPQGLDAYLPIPATTGLVTTGSIGGKTRAGNPVLQHYAELGLTYGAGGTMRSGFTRMRRQANLSLRGMTMGQGGVDFIMMGAGAIDRYQSFCTANSIQFTTPIGDKSRTADIGLPDTGLTFEGLPIVHNPTFEILDAALAPTAPWTRRVYFLNSKTWQMSYAPGKKKYVSFPADPSDVRVTRVSIDTKCVLLPLAPNANAVATIAA